MPLYGTMDATGKTMGLPGSTPGDWNNQQQILERQQQTALQQSQQAFQGQQAGQQRAWQGEQSELQRQLAQWTTGQEQAGQTQRSWIAAQAQELPAWLQQSRWQTTFPWLQQQWGQLSNRPGGGVTNTAPGQPQINAGGVWTPQQIQEQVNAARAQGDQATAAQTRQMQGEVAGRGYGANSPLAMALAGQMQAQNLATGTANERETRMGMAEKNAQQLLSGQQAREQQYASRQQEMIQQQQIQAQRQNALLAALAGMT